MFREHCLNYEASISKFFSDSSLRHRLNANLIKIDKIMYEIKYMFQILPFEKTFWTDLE